MYVYVCSSFVKEKILPRYFSAICMWNISTVRIGSFYLPWVSVKIFMSIHVWEINSKGKRMLKLTKNKFSKFFNRFGYMLFDWGKKARGYCIREWQGINLIYFQFYFFLIAKSIVLFVYIILSFTQFLANVNWIISVMKIY